jgi:hypothetical protein
MGCERDVYVRMDLRAVLCDSGGRMICRTPRIGGFTLRDITVTSFPPAACA